MNADPVLTFHILAALWFFLLGTAVGSFVNVCVYRLPWQKSIFWPMSHCLKCFTPVAPRDNIPILGWIFLRGRCRGCGQRISIRYPLVELLVGTLYLAIYLADVREAPRLLDSWAFGTMLYHDLLATLLVIATFIDYDYYLIPDSVTVPGMVIGLLGGTLWPSIRPEPSTASTFWGGLGIGLLGWAVGGGLVWFFRTGAGLILRREAMGFGDVTLMAMIGSFLGWQAAVLTFFLAPFFGLAHALFKLARLIVKFVLRRPIVGVDREIPFGPYLSLAALMLVLGWSRIWSGWARPLFGNLADLLGWMMGQ